MTTDNRYEEAYYKMMTSVEESIELYKEILVENPTHKNANHDLIIAYSVIGDYVNGMEMAQKYLVYYPEDFRSYCCLGYVEYKRKNYLDSIEWYQKSLTYEEFSGAYHNIGLSYLKLRNFEEAKLFVEKAIRLDAIGKFIFTLSVCYLGLKDYNNAQKQLAKIRGKGIIINYSELMLDSIKGRKRDSVDDNLDRILEEVMEKM